MKETMKTMKLLTEEIELIDLVLNSVYSTKHKSLEVQNIKYIFNLCGF